MLGYSTLFLRGVLYYDAANASGALVSAGFWFVLLGIVAALFALLRDGTPFAARAFAPVWLYLLVRLYSLGEWNPAWTLATLLVGGTLAGWCALAALAGQHPRRRAAYRSVAALAGALVGIGLGSGAGIVAACYALLGYLVLLAAERSKDWPVAVSGAMPFGALFAASWMLIGASMAGGAAVLASVLWLAALLGGLGWALWGASPAGRAPGVASAGLGIGAPLLVRTLLGPVAGQLAGGLSPYGDFSTWPWVGLAATHAAQTPVASWPVIAAALLLLVVLAFLALVARSRPALPATQQAHAGEAALAELYEHVPWLALLLGAPASSGGTGDEPW